MVLLVLLVAFCEVGVDFVSSKRELIIAEFIMWNCNDDNFLVGRIFCGFFKTEVFSLFKVFFLGYFSSLKDE